MAKPADLRAAMSGQAAPAAAPAAEAPAVTADPHHRPGRVGKSNVTGYFEPVVKKQLRLLAVEHDTTIQALLGEALNDLFAKHGKPEVVALDPVD